MLFQDIEHNIILSIKEESKVIFKTLNISEKVFLLVLENIERQDLATEPARLLREQDKLKTTG
ncbi:hypothetical protein HMPREF9978_06220 [Staphylococcus epidermidis NIHLM015]|nr:hypothetical protein HMPREF9978_06220 [Staphylococcus epidermidis NIHLM015]